MIRTLFFLLVFLPVTIFAQEFQFNILNKDSFSPAVLKVTMNAYLVKNDNSENEPMSSNYYELDTNGAWKVRIVTYSDGDESHDSVRYNPKTRTRIITCSSDFEPSKTTTVYNADGTIKSFLSEPGQRDAQLTEYEYDKNQRVTKKTVTFVENKTVEIYQYDERGRILNVKRSSGAVTSKKLQLDYEEKYDYSGNNALIMYAYHYGANDQIRVRDTVLYTYNDTHHVTGITEIRENGGWKKNAIYTYDDQGRIIGEQWEYISKLKEDTSSGHSNFEYDSLGYYTLYVNEETTFAFSNTWVTQYNEFGLPLQCYYSTDAETFYYEWIYEYR